MQENSLLTLPVAALDLFAGDRRQRLIRYLLRWGHCSVALHYLDQWLAYQPGSVTLREQRARILIAHGELTAALALLDAIDAERSPTQDRRQLRLQIMLAKGDYAGAWAQITSSFANPDGVPYAWVLRGDIYRAQGDYEQAAAAYQQAAHLDPASTAPTRRMAALALQQGDGEVARGHIDALMLRPDFVAIHEDLVLLRDAARLCGDAASESALAAQLADREQNERAQIEQEFSVRRERPKSKTALEPDPTPEIAPTPVPATTTERHVLPDEAYVMLREHFGLSDFRPNQARVIAHVLAGRNTLAVMPTGAGKSLTYQLPAMLLPHATVVVSPLIALMKDQIDNLPEAIRMRATSINSSLNGSEINARLRGIAEGRYALVYIAPERLRQRSFLHALKRCGVSLFVVDEAHCVSLWGLNFRPDYLFIKRALAELGHPPLLALTATATPETQAEIRNHLGDLELVSASVFRPNLYFQVARANNRSEKEEMLVALCQRISGPIILYARARQTCEELAELLRQHGISADHYHAHVSDRSATQERFMHGKIRVLVATVAFGMGIDKADIRAIIHYNLPASVEAYYQEAGRAGRDGQPAHCILLYAASDKAQMSRWLREEALDRDQLRELFRVVKRTMRANHDIVNLEQIQRTLGNSDDTIVRVGLSLLERVGLLHRHFDLPRQANVTFQAWPDPADSMDTALLNQLVDVANLMPNTTTTIDLLAAAEHLELTPTDLEGQLLAWHAVGYLRYQGTQRDPLLELLPPSPDVAAQIDELLSNYAARQDERIDAISAYARSIRCRHSTMAEHFGQRLARCRTACDICTPQPLPISSVARRTPTFTPPSPRDQSDPRSDQQRLLDALSHLPFPLGRSGFAKVLKGASTSVVTADRCAEYGALRHLTIAAIEELIETYITMGLIARDEHHEHRRLSLTKQGERTRMHHQNGT